VNSYCFNDRWKKKQLLLFGGYFIMILSMNPEPPSGVASVKSLSDLPK
jgi:hypothetical protein